MIHALAGLALALVPPSIGLPLDSLRVGDWPASMSRPRILLIGDSTFQTLYTGAAKALSTRAEVVRARLGHLSTGAALASFGQLLEGRQWDLVCCNFGLADLMHQDPRTRALRAMSKAAGGVPVTPPFQYALHLRGLMQRLRATGAKILWVTTLPLSSRYRSSAVLPDSIADYNQIALGVMSRFAVPVVDLHARITQRLAPVKPRQRDRIYNQMLKSAPSAGTLSQHLLQQILEEI